jgi:hypothetical protein
LLRMSESVVSSSNGRKMRAAPSRCTSCRIGTMYRY